ncbi:hypothetical protein ACFE04_026884 [Oxalis oulophora]
MKSRYKVTVNDDNACLFDEDCGSEYEEELLEDDYKNDIDLNWSLYGEGDEELRKELESLGEEVVDVDPPRWSTDIVHVTSMRTGKGNTVEKKCRGYTGAPLSRPRRLDSRSAWRTSTTMLLQISVLKKGEACEKGIGEICPRIQAKVEINKDNTRRCMYK